MTGIRTDERVSRTDTPVERYRKCFKMAKKFTIIQLGLSIFIKGSSFEEDNTYEVHSFNFYIFPSSHNEKLNCNFSIEVAAIEFLNQHDTIDYNKWITKGITYFNQTLQKSIRKAYQNNTLKDILENGVNSLIYFQGEEQEKKAAAMVEDFKRFLEEGKEGEQFVCDVKQFVFRKKLLDVYFKEFKQNYQSQLFISQDDHVLKFVKCSPEQKQKLESERSKAQAKQLEEIFGFSSFWEHLIHIVKEKQIPVVGHNMYFDLLFIQNHLIDFLNDDYLEFKQNIHDCYPIIYDTKIVTTLIQQSNLCLGDLYKFLQQNSILKFSVIEQACIDCHNAAYDSFMTGASFLMLKEKQVDVDLYKNCVRLYGHPYVGMLLGNLMEEQVLANNVFAIEQTIDHESEMQKLNLKEFKVYVTSLLKELDSSNIQYQIMEKKTNHNPHQATFCLVEVQAPSETELKNFIQKIQ